MPTSPKSPEPVAALKYPAKRKNLPPAGLEAQGRIQETPRVRHEYNPHLPPALRAASTDAAEADRLPELLAAARKRPLSAAEAGTLAEALRRHQPWLEWSGKRERPWFEVEPVALHMHERVSTQAILRVLARQDVERDLFADPQHDYAQAVQFYRHDVDWANRMILGDSLQVMASLARREDLAGKVQMIYLDPPYGIKFGGNFQPQIGQRDVKDREQDLTREPEMVKAYRDTWTLGVHSYLGYLRDRLAMAKELLADTGSIFVQISDENLHRVRCVMDDVFGTENYCGLISYSATTGQTSSKLAQITDYLIWYAKDNEKVKYRSLSAELPAIDDPTERYVCVESDKGEIVDLSVAQKTGEVAQPEGRILKLQDVTSQTGGESSRRPFKAFGQTFTPGGSRGWSTDTEVGMPRAVRAGYIHRQGNNLWFKSYRDKGRYETINSLWLDARTNAFADPKVYIVQTAPKVIERCILMTTDPGDLVLDPTCGSGTTAFVAEQWGRRWITCDSSRVALALAKHRLMTARFDFHRLRELNAEDVARNPHGTWIAELNAEGKPTGRPLTFQCRTVPHVTLRSIARNASLDPIFAHHEPILAARLAALNGALAAVPAGLRELLVNRLLQRHREPGGSAVTDAEARRCLLPGTEPGLLKTFPARGALRGITPKQVDAYRRAIPAGAGWREWEVPFDADPDWPPALREALGAYRAAWREKMDAVNACIAANAEREELVDKPEPVRGVVRVTGPFSMEGVISVEDGPDASPIGGAPDAGALGAGFDGDAAVQNAEAHLDRIIRLLRASGVDFPTTPETPARNMRFARLDPVTGATLIHAEGEWLGGGSGDGGGTTGGRRVGISVGPEIGNVSPMQVEETLHGAGRHGFDDLVFAGFGFDAAAQAIIDADPNPRVRCHMALIRPDVAMGDLLKTQPGSQLFTVFSAPRVKGPTPRSEADGGGWTVEVEGMDVYDPVSNTLFPTDKERIAAWFLDSDYDGRTFCICQAFFPDRTKWAKLAKALGDAEVIAPEAFEALSGLTSLPFPRPERLAGKGGTWRVAVKVIDPRGNEGLRVLEVR